jgi:hypothetical protein
MRPLLAYCASLWWYWRWLWRSRWNVDWQGKPKFWDKTCLSATFVHHKIPHDQTRVWTRAAAVGSRRLTAWAMARPGYPVPGEYKYGDLVLQVGRVSNLRQWNWLWVLWGSDRRVLLSEKAPHIKKPAVFFNRVIVRRFIISIATALLNNH